VGEPLKRNVGQLRNVMPDFTALETFLGKVPAVMGPIGQGSDPDGMWWVKFGIGFADEIVARAASGFSHTDGLIDLGNVVIETGCERLKQALVKGFGEDWTDKYIAALKVREGDLP
jgi:hypothetical protein